ncbi:hypothetical protein STANM309S_02749 [Streptomyces tanashiensis]
MNTALNVVLRVSLYDAVRLPLESTLADFTRTLVPLYGWA